MTERGDTTPVRFGTHRRAAVNPGESRPRPVALIGAGVPQRASLSDEVRR
ncbi:MAG: hypothetical protein M5U19_10960 [Microthrixaceae bacterium]|nr:hypothetical protein [Microthrixaceae bacterium]